jgi:hypothetical protein
MRTTRTLLATAALLSLAACGTSATHPTGPAPACRAADDTGVYMGRMLGSASSSKDPAVIAAELKAARWPTAAERAAATRFTAVLTPGKGTGPDYTGMLADSLVLMRACKAKR